MNNYSEWSTLPYAGETKPPTNPVDPQAGSWSTYYFHNSGNGTFRNLNGYFIDWNLLDPASIDFNMQLKIVQRVLRNITRKQIVTANYWGTGVATKQWTPIIDRLIDAYDVTPTRAARILAAVHAGISDTFCIAWHFKYLYNVARPNQLDHNLATILCTPRFPAYPSGHAAISGCAETVLRYFFPAKADRLRKLAEENAHSRLLAGVHFPIDNEQGLRLGRQIGDLVVNALRNEQNSDFQPIDVPFSKKNPVKLLSPPYKQALPYVYEGKPGSICGCTSKLSPKVCKRKR
ncbi:MAG: vanadium-dependent haloperoxidase [Paenibacillaceae bacterium]